MTNTLPNERNALPDGYETLSRFATALNEMQVLRDEGQQGWELTSVSLSTLNFRRNPDQVRRWEYLRNSGQMDETALKELEDAGWQYTASWLFHSYNYFKRPVNG